MTLAPFDAARLNPGALALHDAHRGWAARCEQRRAEMRANRAQLGDSIVWTDDAVALADRTAWRPYALQGRVALIGVQGMITPEAGLIGAEFVTGCAELAWQVGLAVDDPQVGGVALMIDSGGGYVSGVDACAAALRAARAVKPLAAIVTGAAYSAGYWIASAADSIAVDRTGGVGHIGVIGEHWDDSAMLERIGIARTVVAEGARKGDRHPALTPEGLADMRTEIAALRVAFAEAVALGRGGAITLEQVLATESRAYSGPAMLRDAQTLGLIDAIAFPREALVAFAGFLGSPPDPAA